MKLKYILLNTWLGLIGIFLVCIAGGYLIWIINTPNILQLKESIINIALALFICIVPTFILAGGGFILFIKILMDPINK